MRFYLDYLSCNETSMTLKISKTKLEKHGRAYEVMFKGESTYPCKINGTTNSHSDNTMIWLHADYNECGINIYDDGNMIIYNQTIVVLYGKNPNSTFVYREEKDEFNVMCRLEKSLTKELDKQDVTAKQKVVVSKGWYIKISTPLRKIYTALQSLQKSSSSFLFFIFNKVWLDSKN